MAFDPVPVAVLNTTQPPAGASGVLFDGVLSTIASQTKTITVPKGVHFCFASAPVVIYTPNGYTAIPSVLGVPVALPAIVADTSITVATISNCATWVAKTLPATATWKSTAFGVVGGVGVFVAIASNAASTIAASSLDGATWTARTLPTSATWAKVAFGVVAGVGTFVAVGLSGTNIVVATSTNGTTWTAQANIASSSTAPSDLAFGNGTFVIVAPVANGLWSSSNGGVTFTQQTSFAVTDGVGVAWNGNVFVAIRSVASSTQTLTSAEGINWVNTNITSGTYTTIGGGNGTLVVTFSSGCIVSYDDGVTWALGGVFTNVGGTDELRYHGGVFTRVNPNLSGIIFTSPNGKTWAQKNVTGSAAWISVAFGMGMYVAVCPNSGTIASLSANAVPATPISFGIYAAPSTVY